MKYEKFFGHDVHEDRIVVEFFIILLQPPTKLMFSINKFTWIQIKKSQISERNIQWRAKNFKKFPEKFKLSKNEDFKIIKFLNWRYY